MDLSGNHETKPWFHDPAEQPVEAPEPSNDTTRRTAPRAVFGKSTRDVKDSLSKEALACDPLASTAAHTPGAIYGLPTGRSTTAPKMSSGGARMYSPELGSSHAGPYLSREIEAAMLGDSSPIQRDDGPGAGRESSGGALLRLLLSKEGAIRISCCGLCCGSWGAPPIHCCPCSCVLPIASTSLSCFNSPAHLHSQWCSDQAACPDAPTLSNLRVHLSPRRHREEPRKYLLFQLHSRSSAFSSVHEPIAASNNFEQAAAP